MLLIYRMIRAGQQKEISAPLIVDEHERRIFRRPRIQLIDVFRRLDGPLLDIADDLLGRSGRMQPPTGESFSQGKHAIEIQFGDGLPPPLTH